MEHQDVHIQVHSHVPQSSLCPTEINSEYWVRSASFLWIVGSYLPASNTEKEAQDIGLLLLLKLFDLRTVRYTS